MRGPFGARAAAQRGDEADEVRLEEGRSMVGGPFRVRVVAENGSRGARPSQLIASVRRLAGRAAFVKLAQGILDGKWKTDVLRTNMPPIWMKPRLRLKESCKKQITARQRWKDKKLQRFFSDGGAQWTRVKKKRD